MPTETKCALTASLVQGETVFVVTRRRCDGDYLMPIAHCAYVGGTSHVVEWTVTFYELIRCIESSRSRGHREFVANS